MAQVRAPLRQQSQLRQPLTLTAGARRNQYPLHAVCVGSSHGERCEHGLDGVLLRPPFRLGQRDDHQRRLVSGRHGPIPPVLVLRGELPAEHVSEGGGRREVACQRELDVFEVALRVTDLILLHNHAWRPPPKRRCDVGGNFLEGRGVGLFDDCNRKVVFRVLGDQAILRRLRGLLVSLLVPCEGDGRTRFARELAGGGQGRRDRQQCRESGLAAPVASRRGDEADACRGAYEEHRAARQGRRHNRSHTPRLGHDAAARRHLWGRRCAEKATLGVAPLGKT
mmetsp:Transcript_4624/g.11596  ORF Transcript_4624/g.11596 Transcript_4624/m.11596 type:complete len:281 (-) Transcript_4624:39-881(-)